MSQVVKYINPFVFEADAQLFVSQKDGRYTQEIDMHFRAMLALLPAYIAHPSYVGDGLAALHAAEADADELIRRHRDWLRP